MRGNKLNLVQLMKVKNKKKMFKIWTDKSKKMALML